MPDKLWLDYFINEDIKNVEYLPPAANITNFYPMDDMMSCNDLCFMGMVNSQHSRISTGSKIVDEFADNIIDMKLSNFDASIMEICKDLFNISYYKAFQQLYNEDSENFWSKIYFLI